MKSVLDRALSDLVQKHGCHSVILYGSRSREDWTEESDYDLIGFRDQGVKLRDARIMDRKFIDAFIYPEAEVIGKERELLRIRQGVVLLEKEAFATKLLQKIDQIFTEGPKLVPEDELQAIRVWIEKMLVRISKGDLEGNYRRVWLQYDLIESYFVLRKKWYLGPKESFRWLSLNDPEAHSLFERALRPNAEPSHLKSLAEKVLAADGFDK